ncbi:MAG: glycosyltransferase family 4 protein [Bacteroidetes bacterium]|nr:glycosyltransferase family 4 protein [Bacteroidota bacterium]
MQKQILYFCTDYSSFVNKDISIFKKEFEVKSFLFNVRNKHLTPLSFIKQFLFILINIFKADLLVCQFAGYHSFLPVLFAKLLFKPSLIILGGTDCVGFPSIRYGNFQKTILSKFTKWSSQLASHLSPVCESLILCDYTYQKEDFQKQGLLFFCPKLKTPYTIIYNGYDEKKWFRNVEKKKNTFITVAGGLKMPFTFQLKGIDLILEIAPSFPECEFTIIGADEAMHLPIRSKNVRLLPAMKHEELIKFYSQSEFYLQLSMSEGFPNALCEAMLCECIPIVSNVGAMPDIIGNTGFVLQTKEIKKLEDLIKAALHSNNNFLSEKAREKIIEHYQESKREKNLLDLINRI